MDEPSNVQDLFSLDAEDYVVVAHFPESSEAMAAVAALEGMGLAPRLVDDHAVRLMWLYSPALGGIRLAVPSSQQREAQGLLESAIANPEPITPEDASYYASVRGERRGRGFLTLLFVLIPGFALLALVLGLIEGAFASLKRRVG